MRNYVRAFKDSYSRLTSEHGEAFFDDFYARFMASDPQVAAKFAGVDLDRQKAMLKASLLEMTLFFVEQQVTKYMIGLATVHGKAGLDIEPRLYDCWLDSLISAMRAQDPGANDVVELAWRVVLAPGIAFMKFQYDK